MITYKSHEHSPNQNCTAYLSRGTLYINWESQGSVIISFFGKDLLGMLVVQKILKNP